MSCFNCGKVFINTPQGNNCGCSQCGDGCDNYIPLKCSIATENIPCTPIIGGDSLPNILQIFWNEIPNIQSSTLDVTTTTNSCGKKTINIENSQTFIVTGSGIADVTPITGGFNVDVQPTIYTAGNGISITENVISTDLPAPPESGCKVLRNCDGILTYSDIGDLTESTSNVLTITGGTGSVIGSGVSIQVRTNSVFFAGVVPAPTLTNKNKVWSTDGLGSPGWSKMLDSGSHSILCTDPINVTIFNTNNGIARYIRVNDIVQVFGTVNITPNSIGVVEFSVPLLFTTSWILPNGLNGTAICDNGDVFYIIGDTVNGVARFKGSASTTSTITVSYSFCYIVV